MKSKKYKYHNQIKIIHMIADEDIEVGDKVIVTKAGHIKK